jgi:hypothetical protein
MGRTAIIYNRPRWSIGRRAAVAGALLAAVVMPMWLGSLASGASSIDTSSSIVSAASARTPVVDPVVPLSAPAASPPPPAALPRSAESPSPVSEPPAAPYRYSGHWRQGSHTVLVLSGSGYSLVARVPGPVDDRFDVVSIDDQRVLLRDRQSQKLVALPLSGQSARPSRDAAKVLPEATEDAPVTPPLKAVASPPTIAEAPVLQFGGGNGSNAEPEN